MEEAALSTFSKVPTLIFHMFNYWVRSLKFVEQHVRQARGEKKKHCKSITTTSKTTKPTIARKK